MRPAIHPSETGRQGCSCKGCLRTCAARGPSVVQSPRPPPSSPVRWRPRPPARRIPRRTSRSGRCRPPARRKAPPNASNGCSPGSTRPGRRLGLPALPAAGRLPQPLGRQADLHPRGPRPQRLRLHPDLGLERRPRRSGGGGRAKRDRPAPAVHRSTLERIRLRLGQHRAAARLLPVDVRRRLSRPQPRLRKPRPRAAAGGTAT